MRLGVYGLGLGLGRGYEVMYDISLSYMMYLPVSHSIPLTIILRSAFCVLRSAKYPCRDLSNIMSHRNVNICLPMLVQWGFTTS